MLRISQFFVLVDAFMLCPLQRHLLDLNFQLIQVGYLLHQYWVVWGSLNHLTTGAIHEVK